MSSNDDALSKSTRAPGARKSAANQSLPRIELTIARPIGSGNTYCPERAPTVGKSEIPNWESRLSRARRGESGRNASGSRPSLPRGLRPAP